MSNKINDSFYSDCNYQLMGACVLILRIGVKLPPHSPLEDIR